MSPFFDIAPHPRHVTHGSAAFDLPILYYRDDSFALFFTAANRRAVLDLMPSDRLHPVTAPGGKPVVGIAAFNYIDTSIGPYGEIGVVVPVVYGRRPPAGLPLLLESRWRAFGMLVAHLPVTRLAARDAGRGQWGYTKFVADMRFGVSPESCAVRMRQGDRHILSMRVERRGVAVRDRRPLVTYSVKNGALIRTTIPQVGTYRFGRAGGGSRLELGDHPVADSIRELGLSQTPFMARCYLERSAILPAGDEVETGVRPLDGFRGEEREGRLEVEYGREAET